MSLNANWLQQPIWDKCWHLTLSSRLMEPRWCCWIMLLFVESFVSSSTAATSAKPCFRVKISVSDFNESVDFWMKWNRSKMKKKKKVEKSQMIVYLVPGLLAMVFFFFTDLYQRLNFPNQCIGSCPESLILTRLQWLRSMDYWAHWPTLH